MVGSPTMKNLVSEVLVSLSRFQRLQSEVDILDIPLLAIFSNIDFSITIHFLIGMFTYIITIQNDYLSFKR